MIENLRDDTGRREGEGSVHELGLVHDWINPHLSRVRPGQAGHLEPHEDHLINEGQVAGATRECRGRTRHFTAANGVAGRVTTGWNALS